MVVINENDNCFLPIIVVGMYSSVYFANQPLISSPPSEVCKEREEERHVGSVDAGRHEIGYHAVAGIA